MHRSISSLHCECACACVCSSLARACAVLLLVASSLLQACTSDEWSGPPPTPDGTLFVAEVYPLLLRDCAFSACHGAKDRFLHLVGPGRTRLDPKTMPDDPVTLNEVLHSYDRCRSMLATSQDVRHALLLSKPLEIDAGGQGHKGIDDFGRNLFATTRDPGYALLLRWANSDGAPPTAAEVDSLAATAMVAEP